MVSSSFIFITPFLEQNSYDNVHNSPGIIRIVLAPATYFHLLSYEHATPPACGASGDKFPTRTSKIWKSKIH